MTCAMLVVLDSVGIGALPDAAAYGDAGANTLGHIAEFCARPARDGGRGTPLSIPNLLRLGLGQAAACASGQPLAGLAPPSRPVGAFGCAHERSAGKDTITGHWEIAGLPLSADWGYFRELEDSFPADLLDALGEAAGIPGFLGNCHASGTEIIQLLGEAHLRSGRPIVYTSADSVIQIAAHEEAFGLERLYRLCEAARVLADPYRVGRVIARPFTGSASDRFIRSAHRRDYAMPPTGPTLLDRLSEAGGEVIGIGKISDIFAGRGITQAIAAHGIAESVEATRTAFLETGEHSLVFTNIVEFDQDFGHRRDVAGYARALETFDALLPRLLGILGPGDLLVLTADHGNDPTWPGSDHTREHIPILAVGPDIRPGSIGRRDGFADIGQSLAHWLGLEPLSHGRSFL